MRSKNANSTFMIPKSNNDVPLWFCQQPSRACRKGYWAVLREIVSILTLLQHDSSREFVLVYLLAEASDAGNITLFKSLRSQYENCFSSIEEILVLYLKLGGSSVKRIADEEFPRAWERRKSEGRGSYLIKHLLKYVSQSTLMPLIFDTISDGSLDDVALLLNSGNSTWLQVRSLTSTNKYSISSQLLSILGELHPDEEISPLSWAILNLNYKIAEEFITTPFAKLGLSPLHYAVLVQSPSLAKLLFMKNVRSAVEYLTYKDRKGRTPLSLAEDFQDASSSGKEILNFIRGQTFTWVTAEIRRFKHLRVHDEFNV